MGNLHPWRLSRLTEIKPQAPRHHLGDSPAVSQRWDLMPLEPPSHQTLGVSGRSTPRGCFQRLDLSSQKIQVPCVQAEDHVSCGCFSTVTLLPAWLWSRAATDQAKRPYPVRCVWMAHSPAAAAQLRVRDLLQPTRELCNVILEVVVVSRQCTVVGQVIQSGPRSQLETKQYKSHMAHVKCN